MKDEAEKNFEEYMKRFEEGLKKAAAIEGEDRMRLYNTALSLLGMGYNAIQSLTGILSSMPFMDEMIELKDLEAIRSKLLSSTEDLRDAIIASKKFQIELEKLRKERAPRQSPEELVEHMMGHMDDTQGEYLPPKPPMFIG